MKFQPPKGTRDFLSEDANKLQKMIDIVRNTFEKYGFEPLITPAFENFELLSVKGGLGEAVKDEIYYFKDKSDRELGLRFDLTMPLARVVISNPQLPKPFKRYVIDKVWRYDNPQALRFREFYQADIDVIGTVDLLADAECIACAAECLDALGFKNFVIRISDRNLAENILLKIGLPKEKILDVFRSIDKRSKLSDDAIKKEIKAKGIDAKIIDKIFNFIYLFGKLDVLEKIEKEFGKVSGLSELKELYKFLKDFGVENKIAFDISLVRGLDYYTGFVYEITIGDKKVAVGGGGRYDKLMKSVGDSDLPATGISLGLSRLFGIAEEANMFENKPIAKTFIANVNEKVKKNVIKIAQKLRKENISCQIDLMNRNLTKQLEYADSLGIPFVVIVGEKELKTGKFKLKDMKNKTEKELSLEAIIKEVLNG